MIPLPLFERWIVAALVVVSVTLGALRANADDPPGFDIPRGAITGKLTRSDTGEPIGRTWLTLQRGDVQRSTATDSFGRFRLDTLPPGTGYQLSFYHDGYAKRAHGPITVDAGKTSEVDFQAVPVDAQVAPYTYSDTYLPGENVAVMVRSIRVTAVKADIFRLDPAAVASGKTHAIDRKTLVIGQDQQPILSFRQPVNGGHQLDWRTSRIEPAFNEPGVYVIRVSAEGVAPKLIPVVVTRLALITKRTPDAVWVWATDLSTGAPVEGVAISAEGDASPARKSDKRGLVRFAHSGTTNVRYWGFRAKDELAYVDATPASAAQALSFRAYVYTDRPAYRPADRVSYKVIARSSDGGVYRVAPDEAWDVVVRDPEGAVVHRETHSTNLFGTFAGALTLPRTPALGEYTVTATSGERTQAGVFKVLEYKKPEYRLEIGTAHDRFVQGDDPIEVTFDARYFFGSPLAGAQVSWTVYETPFVPWWYDFYEGSDDLDPSQGYGVMASSGTQKLDAKGRATAKIEVERASHDRWVTIEATVTDASNREVSARKKVMVTRGDFRLELRPQGKIFQVGEDAVFDVTASGFDGATSVRSLTLTASLEAWSKEHKMWTYETVDTKTLTTDGEGRTRYVLSVKRDGFLRIEAAGKDKWGQPIVESAFVWATKSAGISGGYKKKSLEILTDRKSYEPGDTARILVNAATDSPWVLFSIEGDGLFEPTVARIDGNSRLFEVTLADRHAPNVYASVVFTRGKQFSSLQRSIAVSPAARLLTVSVASDKPGYEPGETAKYTVTVKDRRGQPVKAELSAALVDESVYSISPELAPSIDAFFYGHRPNPVQTAFSYPTRYLGGADKDGQESGSVRRTFKDTAYWNAQVVTGADGTASFEVPLPDNLTEWRLTLRAATADTLVGGATHAIKTSKPLMASLALPRFARRGDRLELVAMIHARGEALSGVKVALTAAGAASVEGSAVASLDVPAGGSASVRFPVSFGSGPAATFTLSASAGKLRDAEERTVPVHAVSVERLLAVSGSHALETGNLSRSFVVPATAVEGTARLDVKAVGSLAGTVMAGVEALAEFPYGCVEQTMNSFLPDLVADKVLKSLGVPRPAGLAALPEMVRTGLRRLGEMQLEDGGFGWFTEGASPWLTAYVVYGWSKAAALEWELDEERLGRAMEALVKILGSAESQEAEAFALYALATAHEAGVTLPSGETVEAALTAGLAKMVPDALDAWGLAVLTLAHQAAGKTEGAAALAKRLAARAVSASAGPSVGPVTNREVWTPAAPFAMFPPHADHYGWSDNPKEATAYALRALVATETAPELQQATLAWLMANRRGGMWDTTKDTAAALEAIVDVIVAEGQLTGDYWASLEVDGKALGKLTVTPATAATAGFDAGVALAAGEHTLSLSGSGTGRAFWTGALTYGDAPVKSATGSLTVARQYLRVARVTAADGSLVEKVTPLDAAGLDVGDQVEVRLTLSTPGTQQFVAIEDLLPSGFEVVPGDLPGYMVNRTDRDDRVAFFATALPKGDSVVSYRLRAEVAGAVRASPAVAWLMYLPEQRASSDVGTLQVSARAQE